MNKKINMFIFLTILIYLIIIFRMVYLFVYDNDKYNKLFLNKNNKLVYGDDGERGRILDSKGNILVDNKKVKRIYYIKNKDSNKEYEVNLAIKLASIINIEEETSDLSKRRFYLAKNSELCKFLISKDEYRLYDERKLSSNDLLKFKLERINSDDIDKFSKIEINASFIYNVMNTGYSYEKKIIKDKNVSDEEYVQSSELNNKNIITDFTWERSYPYGNTLRSILGSVSDRVVGVPLDLKDYYIDKGYNTYDRVGTSYLELYYDEYLRGTKSIYKLNNDNSTTLITESSKGNDLVLSIDINLQKEIDKILEDNLLSSKNERYTKYFNESYAIISEPLTGKILAMSGKKIVDNNIINVELNNINSSFTVGSVVKAASISVGYMNNLIDINTTENDSCIKLYKIPEKCSYKRLGRINDYKALAYSSNYYQFLIAIKSTNNKYKYNMKLNVNEDNFNTYRNVFNDYGLGNNTGIDLPNEFTGIKGKTISPDLLLNYSIGQYDTYTPVQVLQYINTVSNNGNRLSLSLNKDSKINKLNSVSMQQVYFDRIKESLRGVMTIGTGRSYIDKSYNAAGKTGTSESFIDTNNDNIVDTKTVTSTFAAFMPYDNPKISMVVITPNVSYYINDKTYVAPINKKISKLISEKVFEYLK